MEQEEKKEIENEVKSKPTERNTSAEKENLTEKEEKPRERESRRPQRFYQRRTRRFPRKKVCIFCKGNIDSIDYKDVDKLKRFISERGKILPKRITGNCSHHQRKLTESIKRARNIALLPFKAE